MSLCWRPDGADVALLWKAVRGMAELIATARLNAGGLELRLEGKDRQHLSRSFSTEEELVAFAEEKAAELAIDGWDVDRDSR